MNETNIQQDVFHFVAQETGVSLGRLTLTSEIGRDLGLDGDDAIEFIESFGRRFNLEVDNFEYARFFGPEIAWNPIWFIGRIFSLKTRSRLIPIRIEALVESAKQARWVLPEGAG